MIDECVQALKGELSDSSVGMSTVVKRVGEEGFHDPGVVKLVKDVRGRALYFSRSLIPFPRVRTEAFGVFEHVGLYAYTKDCLRRLSQLPPGYLEQIESLEQLRALENGISIQVVETKCVGELVSVDLQADLERVRQILSMEEWLSPSAATVAGPPASLPSSTKDHLEQAIASIVQAKERGGRVVVVTGSGPNLHEGVTTQIAELIRHGVIDGVITSSAVVAHEMAGTLDRVRRIRIEPEDSFELPVHLLPRGRVFEITVLSAQQRLEMEKEFSTGWDMYDRLAARAGSSVIKAAGNMAWPLGLRTERLAQELRDAASQYGVPLEYFAGLGADPMTMIGAGARKGVPVLVSIPQLVGGGAAGISIGDSIPIARHPCDRRDAGQRGRDHRIGDRALAGNS